MGEYVVCRCGLMIRRRMWHDQPQWVHVRSGDVWCLFQRAEPAAGEPDE